MALTRVRMTAGEVEVTGIIMARRPKTRQIYVCLDMDNSKLDDWYSEGAWTVVEEA